MKKSAAKEVEDRGQRKERKGQYEALSKEGQPSTVTEILSSGDLKSFGWKLTAFPYTRWGGGRKEEML